MPAKKPASPRPPAAQSAAPTASLAPLLGELRQAIASARTQILRTADAVQVRTCWLVGRHIVEFEQAGQARAAYGKKLLPDLARHLTTEFGPGFDERNLRNMRSFYSNFPIWDALRSELSWTHYRLLLRVEETAARTWYMNEAAAQNWSTRALERQLGTLYYERLLDTSDRAADDNPSVGVILCARRDESIARYSMLRDHEQLFATKYKLVLPSEEVLRAELAREQLHLEAHQRLGP
ncbi:MAG: PDDEXK nuclease domain-containing protein [Verrucomicrobia bacterium]|nr:PDDEXK nuclease domain-containing protein [Verrucomicrobiota bacterium]